MRAAAPEPDVPCLRIETPQGWLADREALFDRIDVVLVSVLGVPPNDSLIRLDEYAPAQMRLPARSGPRSVYVEVALFAGRSAETKRALYQGLTEALALAGAAAEQVVVALVEIGLDNWGLGGRPASELAFGFEIAV
jgi:4-oxalocrotonate tautomerase family enzyme